MQVSGELDMETAPQLERALRDALAYARLVVLNVREVSFIDSSGLNVLRNAAQRARQLEGRMITVGAPRQVEAVLELTGLRDIVGALPVSLPDPAPAVESSPAAIRPLDNLVNASVIAGRVMSVPAPGLWLHARDGTILRAWAPASKGSPLPAGATVEIYLDPRGAVNGWRHPETGVSVNQRRLPPGAEPATAAPLACRGACGLIWQAPAARELTEHDERCLTCAGPLAPA